MRKFFMVVCMASAVLVAATLTGPAALASSLRVCPSAGPGCPFTSIQAAINAASGASSITIARGTYKENLSVSSTTATALTLVAEGGPSAVIIDGQKKGSVLSVAAGHTVNLIGLTLTNGSAVNGGGIDNEGGTVSVINGRITKNTANFDPTAPPNAFTGFGGGVFNTDAPPPVGGGGTLRLISTLVSGNHADFSGGGVSTVSLVAATQASLTNTTIENNTSSNGAGGINNCGSLTMVSSPIRGNTAAQGGGLTNCGNPPVGPPGTARLINSRVSGNTATGVSPAGAPPVTGHGGGISNGGALTLINSPVSNNTATGPGGGIFNQLVSPPPPPPLPPGTVTRINSPVTGNTGNPPATNQCAGTSC